MASDLIDAAAVTEEAITKAANEYRKPVPERSGTCNNCKEPIQPGLAFCDKLCRDDWQIREDQKIRVRK